MDWIIASLLAINALLVLWLCFHRRCFPQSGEYLKERSQGSFAERVRVEERLCQSENRFRSIFDNTRDVIACLNARGRMLDVNQRVEEVFGYKPDELIGKRFTRFGMLRLKDIPRIVAMFRRAILAGKPNEILELELVRKDGTGVWVEVSTRFIRHQGRVTEVVNVFRDVTERRQTMLELAEAKKAAEAASRAKSQFLANMSHEIRTPLTAILGFADLMLENPAANDIADSTAIIKRNGEHLLNLINDILDLSKIEESRCELELTDCSPRQIAADVIATIKVSAEAKELSLSFDVYPDVPDVVHTDPIRLRQILTNLMGNAVKFTPSGGVRVALRPQARNDRLFVRFDITDTGIGLTPQQMGIIFQPFVQVDASPHRRFGGTGLGLAISKRLAKMLGGDISVTSESGRGSTFCLVIDSDLRTLLSPR